MPELRAARLALLLTTTMLAVLLPGTAAAQQATSFYTHSVGEQVLSDGDSLRGRPGGGRRAFQVEVVRALMRSLKHPQAIQAVPYARGYKLLQEERGVAFFNVVRTPERENSFRWVGPLQVETDYFFESASQARPVRTTEQARESRVCVLRGSAYDQVLTADGYGRLERANSYESCLRMLKAGRVDLMPVSEASMAELVEAIGIPAVEIRRTAIVAGSTTGYIAFSKDLPEAQLQRWTQAFEALRKSPQWTQLQERYLNPVRP
ncbi:transporter substrate-binding domain-containing protein [Pelomonas sp. SE-A7]|uniref:substrate-binding periplasmic protein n=1 Tax=Pelomonas sp. SE-A7 TaxID=3054953 RepID=UPI00259C841A|nr:transporter substrate-binding domain-containing protein [Pelomonas sp. SE-A7]MDM4765799.1 transporter substrate-binding domain-containing protein [Pelomonas sp. SE-A7]